MSGLGYGHNISIPKRKPSGSLPAGSMPEPNMSGNNDPVANNKTFEGTP